jgi:hypothetical protein
VRPANLNNSLRDRLPSSALPDGPQLDHRKSARSLAPAQRSRSAVWLQAFVSVGLLALAACGAKLEGDPNTYQNGFAGGGSTTPGSSGGAASGGTVGVSGGTSGAQGGTGTQGGSTGTPSGGNTANTIPPDDACLADAFTSCVVCHYEGGAISYGVDVKSAGIGQRLAGKASMYTGMKVVDQDKPLESTMYVKIANGACIAAGTCGGKMPVTGTMTETQVNCVRDWLLKF